MIMFAGCKTYQSNTELMFAGDDKRRISVSVSHTGDDCGPHICSTPEEWISLEWETGSLKGIEVSDEDREMIDQHLAIVIDHYWSDADNRITNAEKLEISRRLDSRIRADLDKLSTELMYLYRIGSNLPRAIYDAERESHESRLQTLNRWHGAVKINADRAEALALADAGTPRTSLLTGLTYAPPREMTSNEQDEFAAAYDYYMGAGNTP